jgi:hypothetical protein
LLATDTSSSRGLRREFVHNFATLADAVASTKILAGDSVNLKERTTGNGGGAIWDVVLASSVTPNGDNVVASTGNTSLALSMQEELSPTHKFRLQQDQARGKNFLEIRNTEDDVQIISFADGVDSGDAHVMKLPPDIRRDSHALLATAGTFGGENDIDFRTYKYSDYILLRGSSVYQNEAFQLLFDTKPSRNDSTKKNGTGGGGLSPADDVYAFDAAMIVPSNRTDTPVQFPALGVLFEQYVQLEKRTGASRKFRFTPEADSLVLTDEVSGNEIIRLDHERTVTGGQTCINENKTGTLCETSGNFQVCRYISSVGASTILPLVASGRKGCAEIFTSLTSSGGVHWASRLVVEFDGTTITNIVAPYDTTPAEANVVLAYNTGILELELSYAGGWGGALRASVKAELMLTAA